MSSSPPSSSTLPRQFGRYVLYERIGEGGMAEIYLGRERTALGGERRVVVKHILPLFAESAELAKLLVDEAKLAAQLSHGNVVQVFDLGREEGKLYIAMEYVEGFDLRELLRSCTRAKIPLPVDFSLLIVMETLRALDYAHRKRGDDGRPLGIVHRDVSPSNILVSFDGQVKLCDFGIARAFGVDSFLPEEAIQGKAGYMSPEAALGQAVTAQSDVFAIGVILWELLAGRRLYRGEGKRPPTLEQARVAEIPPVPRRGLPGEETLLGIVDKALERAPTRRFGSSREMLKQLEAYVAQHGLVASPLRLGEWLTESFGQEMLERRRTREHASHSEARGVAPELDSLTGMSTPLEGSQAGSELSPLSMEPVAHTIRRPETSDVSPEAPSPVLPRWLWIVIVAVVAVCIALIVLLRPSAN